MEFFNRRVWRRTNTVKVATDYLYERGNINAQKSRTSSGPTFFRELFFEPLGHPPFHLVLPLPPKHSSHEESSRTSAYASIFLSHLPPDECLATIFSKLGCEDRNASSLACRWWKAVKSKCRQRLILRAHYDLSPFLPHLLLRFENVYNLALKCSRKLISLDDRALARIASGLPRLKKLKLKGCVEITDDGLRSFSLSCSPCLKKFSCGSCGFGVRALKCCRVEFIGRKLPELGEDGALQY